MLRARIGFPFLVSFLGLLLALSVASAALAEDGERSKTVSGLLELLEAEMTQDVILHWLGTRPAEPRPPSARDLLDLRAAGADDAVLTKLLSLSGSGPAGETADETADPAAQDREAPEPATPTGSEETKPTPPLETTQGESAEVPVDFTLSYLPDPREGETSWDLYVYLDGKPLSYVKPGSRLLGDDPLRFEQVLPAGRHQVRIAQENHQARDAAPDLHEARMAPVDLVFHLEPGTPAEVEIRVHRPLVEMGSDGPVSYRVAQGGRVLLAEDETGGDPDEWTPVCDDAGSSGLDEPRGCRGWPTFWTVEAPPRRQVLRALSLFEYRPVPRNQKMH